MKKNNYLKYVVLIGMVFVIYFISQRLGSEPIENLIIQPGVGYDIEKDSKGNEEYEASASIYIFEGSEVSSMLFTSKSSTAVGTRQERQKKLNKRFILGFEKVYIFGEDMAKFGTRNILDPLLKNPWVNDNGFIVVCKGKAKDVLKLKIKGQPSSADYIDGLINNSKYQGFFSRKYALIDMYKHVDAEGLNFVAPYIEIKDEGVEITGLAIFNKDKMVTKLDMDDSRVLNMLREDDGLGILEVIESPEKYASINATSKRKAECTRENDKYKFTISLDFKGEVIANQLYPGMMINPEVEKEFADDLERQVKSKCKKFIDKMQNDYKIDMLNLGSTAASKYGRHSGADWNEEVSNADIEIDVKVTIESHDRGNY